MGRLRDDDDDTGDALHDRLLDDSRHGWCTKSEQFAKKYAHCIDVDEGTFFL